ncbi:MAG: peptidoglycan editing factor PgeF [Pseudomonadota bacterium]|nr:peptidoglycan editing factor PgeF [Pseudomonadota bacterium]
MNKQTIKYFRNFKFCFFKRTGGVSTENFSSLNCAFNIEEKKENVKKNRAIIKKYFCKTKKIIFLNQTHSNKVFFLNKKIPNIISADGIITDRKDLCLGILTADCAPIIILGNKNFGIVHAGWRGAFSNIIRNAVKVFISKGEIISDLQIFIGPHLKKKSFEVKKNFVSKFFKNNNSRKFIVKKKEQYFFDFSNFLKNKILDLGISKVCISNLDTFSSPKRFFSYRYYSKKGIINCGRQISLVCFR